MCFVDYEKAFYKVDWNFVTKALKRIGVDWSDRRRVIASLYLRQTALVRVEDELSMPGNIGRRVHQPCPQSLLLFKIYIEELIREAVEKTG